MTPWIDGESIDREIAEATTCEECGEPMKYEPRVEPGYYEDDKPIRQAWAVCTNPKCENEFEF